MSARLPRNFSENPNLKKPQLTILIFWRQRDTERAFVFTVYNWVNTEVTGILGGNRR